jgi:hypothetical protein
MYVLVFFVFNDMWETVAHFVDISGIIDYHCLTFLFIITHKTTLATFFLTKHTRGLIEMT